MANKIFNTRVKNKRDTEANWKSKNPVLLDGEIIIVTTTSGDTRFKVGDGNKTYNQLPFQDQKTRDLIPSVDSSLSSTSTNPVQNKIIKSELDKKAERNVVNTTTNGLMSVADKKKLDGIDAGANKITVDTSLSSTSTNPVQNKVVNSAINNLNTLVGDTAVSTQIQNAIANKVDKVSGKGLSTNDYTTAEKEQVAANTTARHTHNNKAVLDKITSEKTAEWDSSIIVTFHGRWNETDNSIVFSSTSTPYDDIQALLAAGKTPELSIQNDYGDWEAKFYLSRDGDGQYQFFSYEHKMDGTPLLSYIAVLDDNSARWRGIDLDNKLDCSGGTMTGQLTLNSTLILRSATYGDTLPSSGVAGQIFFKKV